MPEFTDTSRLTKLETKSEGWEISLKRLESKVDHIVESIGKFATIEEKMFNHSTAVERAFAAIERVRDVQKSLKDDLDNLAATQSKWINLGRGAWWVVSLIGGCLMVYVYSLVSQVDQDRIRHVEQAHKFLEIDKSLDNLHDRLTTLEQDEKKLHNKTGAGDP